jgi:hypothetical protein
VINQWTADGLTLSWPWALRSTLSYLAFLQSILIFLSSKTFRPAHYLFPHMLHSSSISYWPYNRWRVAAVELSLRSLLLFAFPSRPFSETARTTFDFFSFKSHTVLLCIAEEAWCTNGEYLFLHKKSRSKESINNLKSLTTCVWDYTHAVPHLLPPYKVRIVRTSWQRPSFTPIQNKGNIKFIQLNGLTFRNINWRVFETVFFSRITYTLGPSETFRCCDTPMQYQHRWTSTGKTVGKEPS